MGGCFQAFVERLGGDTTWVYVPGWALDGRLFEEIDLGGGRVVVSSYVVETFVQDLYAFLASHALSRVSLFGVSLGGFLVTDFVKRYPHRVDRCVLVGMKPSYDESVIEGIRRMMARSSGAYLKSFYRACFVTTVAYDRFMKRCGLDLVQTHDVMHCLEGLGYLSRVMWSLALWPSSVPVCVVQGVEDGVAPLSDMQLLMAGNPCFFPLAGAGHLCLDDSQALMAVVRSFFDGG